MGTGVDPTASPRKIEYGFRTLLASTPGTKIMATHLDSVGANGHPWLYGFARYRSQIARRVANASVGRHRLSLPARSYRLMAVLPGQEYAPRRLDQRLPDAIPRRAVLHAHARKA